METMKTMIVAIMAVMVILVTLCLTAGTSKASEFSITSPMETAPSGFWFPSDGTFAVGINHTFLRIQHNSIPKLMFDADIAIAKEVSQENKTLGGLGLKLVYKTQMTDQKGFAFEPSIGLSILNDFASNKKLADILDNYRVAVYGTILLYRW